MNIMPQKQQEGEFWADLPLPVPPNAITQEPSRRAPDAHPLEDHLVKAPPRKQESRCWAHTNEH